MDDIATALSLAHMNWSEGIKFPKNSPQRKTLLEAAAEIYYNVLREDPEIENRIAIHHDIGVCLYNLNRFEESAQELEKAIQKTPDFADPNCWLKMYMDLGNAYYESGSYEQAERCFQKLIELSPKRSIGHFKLGKVFFAKGDLEKAIIKFENTIKISSGHNPARNSLGVLLNYTGEYDCAINQFSAAIETDPKDIIARANLADSLRLIGKESGAMEQYEIILGKTPSSEEDYLARIIAERGLNKINPLFRGSSEEDAIKRGIFREKALERELMYRC